MLRYATALRSPNLMQRRTAVKELAQLGALIPAAALAYLGPLLNDEDEAVRDAATEALANAGPAHPATLQAAIGAVAQMLTAPLPGTRMRGIAIADRLGPAARALIPALVSALRDTNLILARTAAAALIRIGPEAIPALQGLRDDPDHHVRREARWALKKLEGGSDAGAETFLCRPQRTPVEPSVTEHVPLTSLPASLQATQRVAINLTRAAERRVQTRYPCRHDTFYCFLTDLSRELWWHARICDVSEGGIGMLATRKAKAGTRLTIDLEEADAGVPRRAVARVAHCRPTNSGWHLGCRLIGPLLADDLRRLREDDGR